MPLSRKVALSWLKDLVPAAVVSVTFYFILAHFLTSFPLRFSIFPFQLHIGCFVIFTLVPLESKAGTRLFRPVFSHQWIEKVVFRSA